MIKKSLPRLVLFGLLVVTLIIGFLVFSKAPPFTSQPSTFNFPLSTATPTPTPYFHTIALLGYGGGTHAGGVLTDSMMLVRIDDLKKKVFLVSVPRDLWIDLPLGKGGAAVGHKVNAAYAYGLDDTSYPDKPKEYTRENGGGGALATWALAQITGEPIDHFISVSFASFTSLVDQLGGVSVTRSTQFVDEWYPIEGKENELCDHKEEELKDLIATLSGRLLEQEFPCRYEKLVIAPGTSRLDGPTALKYARSRKSDTEGGDFSRSQHQREVFAAITEKALALDSVPGLVGIATSLGTYIDTDFRLLDVGSLLHEYMRKRDYTIESIALTDDNALIHGTSPRGQYILQPYGDRSDWRGIHAYLTDRYSGLSEASATARLRARYITPTPTPTPIPQTDTLVH